MAQTFRVHWHFFPQKKKSSTSFALYILYVTAAVATTTPTTTAVVYQSNRFVTEANTENLIWYASLTVSLTFLSRQVGLLFCTSTSRLHFAVFPPIGKVRSTKFGGKRQQLVNTSYSMLRSNYYTTNFCSFLSLFSDLVYRNKAIIIGNKFAWTPMRFSIPIKCCTFTNSIIVYLHFFNCRADNNSIIGTHANKKSFFFFPKIIQIVCLVLCSWIEFFLSTTFCCCCTMFCSPILFNQLRHMCTQMRMPKRNENVQYWTLFRFNVIHQMLFNASVAPRNSNSSSNIVCVSLFFCCCFFFRRIIFTGSDLENVIPASQQ